ncbi:integration host factor subunit alpha [Methylocystis sp. S23]|jgi:integration host factor subunit alpha
MAQEEFFSLASGALNDADDPSQTTITRADLAEAVHQRTGLGRTESAKYVEMVLDEIFRSIAAREDVKLSSFGSFLIRAKKERQGRNPKTGEGAKICARLVVTFKPSNVLRAKINVASDDLGEPPKPRSRAKATGSGKPHGTGKPR